jgi:hypothetical protein
MARRVVAVDPLVGGNARPPVSFGAPQGADQVSDPGHPVAPAPTAQFGDDALGGPGVVEGRRPHPHGGGAGQEHLHGVDSAGHAAGADDGNAGQGARDVHTAGGDGA